jgi:ribosomal protein L11 methyltransferase
MRKSVLVPDVWRVACEAPEEDVEIFSDALSSFVDTVSWFATEGRDAGDGGPWLIEAFCREVPERGEIIASLALAAEMAGLTSPTISIEKVAGRDWLADNLSDFPPIAAGRFFVHGSHFEGPLPSGFIPLLVDAGTAFGSGEHATTHACLLALNILGKRKKFKRPLDMGCGSGILALAAAKIWRGKVRPVAADIDSEAVRVAGRNARLNGVVGVRTQTSDGYRHRMIEKHAPYDLILANILARPLMRMAKDLNRHLSPNGVAVLSGLLERQENMVLSAHRPHGLRLIGRVRERGWSAIILSR